MANYEDDGILLDENGLTIKNYRRPGDSKQIAFTLIRSIERFDMGIWSGRYRVIGISFGRPRNWFHWDARRRGKRTAISLDLGKWIRPAIVPRDPDTAEEILRGAIGRSVIDR